MKAIRMRIQKSSRPLVILLATVVAIITSMVVANATQTITTPNAVKITYNLAAGAYSATITPATSTSVLVMGCCTGQVGVGQVSLLHLSNNLPSNGMTWVGLESWNGSSTTTTTARNPITSTLPSHIVYLDNMHKVDIQVNTVDTIRVHNSASVALAGNVTLVW